MVQNVTFLANILCELEKNVDSAAVEVFYKCQLDPVD